MEPRAGKALELVGAAAAASARASYSKVCDPAHLRNECLVVGKKLHWRVAGSVVYEGECSRDRLVWQRASPWLAGQAGLWQGHSWSTESCWHSPRRRSRLECSCCL